MINKPKILIIDDIRDNIYAIKALTRKNFPSSIILTALSGDLGVELAKSTIPDVILLDILMPIKDGYLVCEELKGNVDTHDIPVIFVTAFKEEIELKIKALNVGAEGFLTKPIDEPTLIATISAMLKLREADIYRADENKRLKYQVYLRTKSLENELKEKLRSEMKLRDSESRYIGLIENLDSGVVVYDANTLIISASEKAVELFGILSTAELVGKYAKDPYWMYIDENSNELKLSEIPATIILRTQKPLKNYVIGITTYDNTNLKWLKCNGFPRFDIDGKLKEIVISFMDITTQILREKEINYLSYHDQLTGLYNRRFFDEEMIRLDNPRNYPITVVMGDVNGLKLVNDAFGHTEGDNLLKEVGRILKDGCRANDVVCRWGGDEFGILLTGTSNKEATVMLERIIKIALNTSYKFGPISISFGYETKVDSNQSLNKVFLQAEELMYSNKMDMSKSVRSETIGIILNALFEKSSEVKLHTERVSKYAEMIAVAMRLPKAKIIDIKTIGNLHDIGKIAIDMSIIDKPGMLTEKEYEAIKQHSVSGARMLASSHEYDRLSSGVLHHHERYDGKGYPNNLVGENIPLESRIISVADAYDAMTSERSYKNLMTKEEAIAELIEHSGTQFDKVVVEAFVASLEKDI